MINLDDELAKTYLAECCEHLANTKKDLLAIEKGGAQIDEQLVSRAFRDLHSVMGAGFFNLVKICELAHQLEDVLALVRSHEMVPRPSRVRVLQQATDRLLELVQNPGTSNDADIAETMTALATLCEEHTPYSGRRCTTAIEKVHQSGDHLRVLLVEDDFASRLVLQTFLSRYGECHVAVNGREAVEAFQSALESRQSYDLICMDIMMPEMDGCEAVRRVRAMEEARGIFSDSGAKIIMTTAITDIKEVIRCFKELCDAYLMKPIDLGELLSKMQSYQLVPTQEPATKV